MTGHLATRWQFGTLRGTAERTAATVVIKFGGSLLERPDWPELAAGLLSARIGSAATLVIGGGSIVDGIRLIDQIRSQPDPLAHRLAVEGMGITARLVAATLGLPLVTRPMLRHAVIDPVAWLTADPMRAAAIPASWQVTSDSLAARVAHSAGLGLWLAKSVAPPCADSIGVAPGAKVESLAAAGWVDEWFPAATVGLEQIGWAAPAD